MTIYLLQVSLAWLAFLLLYVVGFRKEKLFVANRIYLLAGFCLALLLPFISWPIAQVFPVSSGSDVAYWLDQVIISSQPNAHQTTAAAIPWLWVAYWAGCGLALLRLLWGLSQIESLIRKTKFRREAGILLGETPGISSPFSWGPYLFLNRDLCKNREEYRAIVAHEKAHIRQVHSFDVLVLQLVGVFFWWNPLWYAYRKMLTDVHEYLADAEAIQQLPRRAYGKLLLLQHVNAERVPHLSHAFYTSQIKSRIMMLTKKKVGRYAAWKYLAILPVLALVLFACNAVENPDTVEMKKSLDDYESVEQVDTIITFHPDDYSETIEIVTSTSYKEAEIMPLFGSCPDVSGAELRACSDQNMLEYIYNNITYPKSASALGLQGMIITKLIISPSGKLQWVEIAKSDLKGDQDQTTASEEETSQLKIGMKAMENEVLQVVRSMPDWQPGTIDDQPVQVQIMLPVRFKME